MHGTIQRIAGNTAQDEKPSREEAEDAVRTLIRWAGETPRREGLVETPARVVRAYEEWFEGYGQDPAALLQRTFEEVGGYNDMIVLRDIPFESCCEHHMAAIRGVVHVGYLPNGRVVGISKLARVVDAYARRMQVQERLTAEIADLISTVLAPHGVGVVIKASHACMSTRGVRKHGVSMVTSRMLGNFRDDAATRNEFLSAIALAESDMVHAPNVLPDLDRLTDADLVRLACSGTPDAFGTIITRYNQRLYRVARAVLRDGAEAEDALQEAYLRAFAALDGFRNESGLGTWLTRIVVNEALGRLKRQRKTEDLDALDRAGKLRSDVIVFPGAAMNMDPEQTAALGEIRRLLERAIDALPEPFRLVFVLRDIEGMSIEETAEQAGLQPATVKTRLHRARKLLREELNGTLSMALQDTFPFGGTRCARIRGAVMARISEGRQTPLP